MNKKGKMEFRKMLSFLHIETDKAFYTAVVAGCFVLIMSIILDIINTMLEDVLSQHLQTSLKLILLVLIFMWAVHNLEYTETGIMETKEAKNK